jgi:hypothetical protein
MRHGASQSYSARNLLVFEVNDTILIRVYQWAILRPPFSHFKFSLTRMKNSVKKAKLATLLLFEMVASKGHGGPSQNRKRRTQGTPWNQPKHSVSKS